MNKKYYPEYKETIYEETLPNGLKVILMPKKDYSSTYAHFTTKFGGKYYNFKVGDQVLVSGLAHFLEHRLFDYKGHEIIHEMEKLGASTNAFTSYDITSFLFHTSKNLDKCLNLLLDFVQGAEFPEEKVENEKKIISQEYHLHDDNIMMKLFEQIISNVCVSYPMKEKIVGSLEDINKTTRDLLYLAHRTFYHPSNMKLVVVGGFDPSKVIKIIRNNQNKKHFEEKVIPTLNINEPLEVAKKEEEVTIGLPYQKVAIGLKYKPKAYKDKKEELRHQNVVGFVKSLLFGDTSKVVEDLIRERILLGPVMMDTNIDKDINFSIMLIDTLDSKVAIERIEDILKHAPEYISKERFESEKRDHISSSILSLDSVSACAESMVFNGIYDTNILEFIDLIKSITYEDVVECAKEMTEYNKAVVIYK